MGFPSSDRKDPGARNGRPAGCCSIEDLFRLFGKSYVMDLLYIFLREAPGPHRFVDLQKRLKISPNTLSDRLRELVGAGLLLRTPYNEIPPRVDYAATDKARELKPVFKALREWAGCNTLEPVPLVVKVPK